SNIRDTIYCNTTTIVNDISLLILLCNDRSRTKNYTLSLHGALPIFQVQEFHQPFAQVHLDQSAVPAYAVLRVDDGIACPQLGQIPHHGGHVADGFLATPSATYCPSLARVQVVFC